MNAPSFARLKSSMPAFFFPKRRGGILAALTLITLALSNGGCTENQDSLAEIRKLHRQGKYIATLEPLRQRVSENPDDAESHFLYGSALRRTGAPDMAIWSLRKAAENEQWRFLAGLELGGAALAGQEWQNAIEIADQLLTESPDEIPILLIRAQARMGQKNNYEGALEDCARIIELEPNHIVAHSARASALIALERVDEAADALDALTDLAGEAQASESIRGTLCVTRALFTHERGDEEQSEALFAECAEAFPKHPTVVEEYAGYFDARGERERANEAIARALDEKPNSSTLRLALSRRLLAEKRLEESEQLLRDGIALPHKRARSDAWLGLADHYVMAGNLTSAAAAFEESLQLIKTPSQFQILTFADVLVRSGQLARAREVAKGLENSVYRGLIEARITYEQGEPQKALDHLDTILPLWPNNPGARYYAARAAEQVGDFPRAIQEYRQSIRSSPAFTEAGLRLGLIFEAAGDGDSAWAAVGPYADATPGDLEAISLRIRLASRYGPARKLQSVMQSYLSGPRRGRAIAERADFIARVAGPAEAIQAIREVENLDLARPEDADALRSLLRHLATTGQFEVARKIADAAIQARGDAGAFYLARGELNSAAGQPAAAKVDFEKALALDARLAEAQLGLARLAGSEEGGGEDAEAYFEQAIRSDPRLTQAYVESASALGRAGELERSERRWEALLREKPEHAGAAVALAESRLSRGDYGERTLELASRAIRFRGGIKALRTLARVHRLRGEEEQAEELTKRADAAAAAKDRAPATAQPDTGDLSSKTVPRERYSWVVGYEGGSLG